MKLKSIETNGKGVALHGIVEPNTEEVLFIVTTFKDGQDMHSYTFKEYTQADLKFDEIVYAN